MAATGYLLVLHRQDRARDMGGACRQGLVVDVLGKLGTNPREPGVRGEIFGRQSRKTRQAFAFLFATGMTQRQSLAARGFVKRLRCSKADLLAIVDEQTRTKLRKNFALGSTIEHADLPTIPVAALKALFRDNNDDRQLDIGD